MENQYLYHGSHMEEWEVDETMKPVKFVRSIAPEEYLKIPDPPKEEE